MENQEKAPFEVDLQKLVQDLANYKNQVESLTKEKEEVVTERDKYKTDYDNLTVKYNEVEKKNGELYLQVAQSIVRDPNEGKEEKQEETSMSLEELTKELNKGI